MRKKEMTNVQAGCFRNHDKMRDPLTKLAIKYGSDRHPESKHSYTPYYYKLFKGRRQSVKKILEIGAGEGAGLRMWRDYFPNATVYGADNDEKRIFKEERIDVIHCDQSSRGDLVLLLDKTGTNIDFVVDDASHKPQHQVFTCLTLMPFLNHDVVYIIEDVADLSIIGNLGAYEIEVPKLNRWRKRYDDWLVIARHQKT